MSQSFLIAGRRVSHDDPPYIIAEMSANHGGDLDRAKRIIRLAAEAGADAIKFQAYTADSLTLDSNRPDFLVKGDSLWRGRRLFELYQSAATPYKWFPELFALARQAGITPFATAFGLDAIEMLEPLDPPVYKIASFEAVDLELIAACARTGRPMIISTGLCTELEAADALQAARQAGARDVVLLKCSSAYPAPLADTNLLAIPRMRRDFDALIGYSDHTLGPAVSIAACALGACMIEKHFIDSREPPTADSAFSALPEELKIMIEGCRAAFLARGGERLAPSEAEKNSIVFRRSLYACTDIAAGEIFGRSNVRSVRPGYGLAPKFLRDVLGRRARRAILRGEPILWDNVE